MTTSKAASWTLDEAMSLLALKVELRDRRAVERLCETGLVDYLAAHRWRKTGEMPNREDPLTKPAYGTWWKKGKYTLFAPADWIGDRLGRTGELLVAISRIERRSQLLVYRDLLRASRPPAE